MSGRRRTPTTRAEMIAKLEHLAALSPSASLTEQQAWCAKALGLGEMSDAGWARVFVEMSRINFMKTGDPLYAWKALMACRRRGLGVPLWVDNYLCQVTARIIDPNGLRGDLGRVLPRALGFSTKRGTRGKVPDLIDDVDGTRLAIAFARAIMDGAEPDIALARACDGINAAWTDKDKRTLLACVRKRFNITGATRTRAQWEAGISTWFDGFVRLEQAVHQ
jgi:hypothetical protein